MADERIEKLAEHLGLCYAMARGYHFEASDTDDVDRAIARGIVADPQAIIDALVAAGVLKTHGLATPKGTERCYVVPHVHVWKVVTPVGPLNVMLGLRCVGLLGVRGTGCDETRMVDNRWPVEVPETRA